MFYWCSVLWVSITLWRPLLQDRVKPSFAILTSWHSSCPDVKITNGRLNPVWHRMLYSCTHMATVGVKGAMLSVMGCISSVQSECRTNDPTSARPTVSNNDAFYAFYVILPVTQLCPQQDLQPDTANSRHQYATDLSASGSGSSSHARAGASSGQTTLFHNVLLNRDFSLITSVWLKTGRRRS